jgi:hypothetical protein
MRSTPTAPPCPAHLNRSKRGRGGNAIKKSLFMCTFLAERQKPVHQKAVSEGQLSVASFQNSCTPLPSVRSNNTLLYSPSAVFRDHEHTHARTHGRRENPYNPQKVIYRFYGLQQHTNTTRFLFHSDPLIFRLFDRHCIGRAFICPEGRNIYHIEIEGLIAVMFAPTAGPTCVNLSKRSFR